MLKFHYTYSQTEWCTVAALRAPGFTEIHDGCRDQRLAEGLSV